MSILTRLNDRPKLLHSVQNATTTLACHVHHAHVKPCRRYSAGLIVAEQLDYTPLIVPPLVSSEHSTPLDPSGQNVRQDFARLFASHQSDKTVRHKPGSSKTTCLLLPGQFTPWPI